MMELTDTTTKKFFETVGTFNSRSRKYLGFKTPYETLKEIAGLTPQDIYSNALMT